VEDVVAVEVRLADGGARYFLTWGRIQDRVDPGPVCELVLRSTTPGSLRGDPVGARLCGTLREAAQSPEAPYFYECILSFCHRPIPFGDGYEAWRTDRDRAMQDGREISYCGRPPKPGPLA
jgi:hypothetical protein